MRDIKYFILILFSATLFFLLFFSLQLFVSLAIGGEVVVKQMEVGGEGSLSSSSKGNDNNDKNKNNLLERKARSQKDQPLKCPRCNSSNTKFCYYNNYSLSEPRYFCKSCRRYWTERKNKRSFSLSSSADDKKIKGSDQTPKINHHHDHDQDHLNLTIFPPTTNHHHFPSSTTISHLSGSFMAAAPPQFNSGGGFGLHELIKPSLSFSDLERLESDDGGYVNLHQNHHHQDQDQDQTAVMFPIEDLKQSKSK